MSWATSRRRSPSTLYVRSMNSRMRLTSSSERSLTLVPPSTPEPSTILYARAVPAPELEGGAGPPPSDCVVIITPHAAIDYRALVEASALVFDTRNAVGGAGVHDPKVVRL